VTRPRFHLAFPVHDLGAAREFYGELLGCPEGRSDERWVDFDFRGHQLVAHLSNVSDSSAVNVVDSARVPVRHFGLILDWREWEELRATLERSDAEFIIEPQVRFEGRAGEQATMLVRDPSGNALEFKAFRDERAIFDRGKEPPS